MQILLCAIGLVLCFFSNGVLCSAALLHIEKTFTKADGLASNTVLAILEDSQGNMWFGTTEGVTCYDGQSFQTFTTEHGLAQNTLGLIFEDQHEMLWFAGGVLSSVLEIEKSVDMSLMEMPLSELANMSEDEMPEDIITPPISLKGLSRYDGQTFRIFTTAEGISDNRIRNIFEDQAGTLWLSTGNGVSRYDGEKFNNIIMEAPIGMEVLPEWWNDVTTIAQDTADNFWFGSTAGITYYKAESSQLRYFAVDADLTPFQEMGDTPTAHITDLQFDAQNNLWISRAHGGGERSGIYRYDGKKLTTFVQSEELPMNSVHNIMLDSRGNLWFTGIKTLPPTVYETEDSLYITSPKVESGVSVYNGETFQNFNTRDGLPSNRVWSVSEDSKGNLWFATDAGVSVGVYVPSAD